MKKIVSAAAIAAVVAGSAFADFSIKGNARTHLNVYSRDFAKESSSQDTVKIADLEKSNDSFDFEAKSDYSLVHATLALKNTDNSVALDTKYWGRMTFGSLNLTAGKFENLFTKKGNTTLVEEGLTDGGDWKGYGLSSILSVNGSAIGKKFMYDANTVSAVAGTRVLSFFADYTVSDVADGKLLFKVGLTEPYSTSTTYETKITYSGSELTNITDLDWDDVSATTTAKSSTSATSYRTDTTKDEKTTVGAGYVFDVALQRKDVTVEAMVRTTSYYDIVAGLYADLITLIPMSDLKLGFTWGSTSKKADGTAAGTTGEYNAWAIDWRYTVKPTKELQLVLNGKYEQVQPKADGADAESGLYIIGQVGYVVSDLINVAFDAGLYYTDLDDNDKSDKGENYVKIRPAVELKAGAGAKLTTALEYTSKLNTGDMAASGTKSSFKVPVIFRVKL